MQPHDVLILSAGAALLLVGGVLVAQRREFDYASQDPDDAPGWADLLTAAAASARDAVAPSPVADMAPSAQLVAMLRRAEGGAHLKRYRIGDGGWTIGVGRFYRDPAEPPESITADQAEAWFAEDIEARAARWVRAYVSVPLLQHQFDALTHMAYNLSPKSFRTIARAVNDGQDPEAAAMSFVLAGTDKEKGLRNRRARELDLYREGRYA